MSVVEIPPRLSCKPLTLLVSFLSQINILPWNTECGEEENRARRDFIMEMMDAHPEAFQHEIDCQTMMRFYPSRF